MNSEERRPPFYLITGLVIGIAFGLLYAWVWQPVEHIDTLPYSMKSEYKDAYRALIAAAYVADGDLGRAEVRLALLGDEDPARSLEIQAQRLLSEDKNNKQARPLGILAVALGSEMEIENVTSLASTPKATGTLKPDSKATATGTPTLIPTMAVTRTPTATPGAAFVVRESLLVCEPELKDTSLIQVYIFNAANQPVPGMEIVVSWDGGEEHFFSGLKPEFGLGYADFEMQTGTVYNLQLASGGETAPGLTPTECQGEDGSVWFGSWRVNYIQE